MKYYASFPITAENSLNNRAINYGDGLFETMLVTNKSIPLWEFHYQRLKTSCLTLNLEAPKQDKLLDNISSLVSDKMPYITKLVVFRDDKQRGYSSKTNATNYFIVLTPYHPKLESKFLTVSSVKLSKQLKLAGLKHLNRLEQVLAASELIETKYSDAIMLYKKTIIETTSKNIILIKGKKLFSPKINKCGVHGVALRWLGFQGYNIKWKKIEIESMDSYDGFMVCNSIHGFNSITKIDNRFSFYDELPIIKEIQQKWYETIKLT